MKIFVSKIVGELGFPTSASKINGATEVAKYIAYVLLIKNLFRYSLFIIKN